MNKKTITLVVSAAVAGFVVGWFVSPEGKTIRRDLRRHPSFYTSSFRRDKNRAKYDDKETARGKKSYKYKELDLTEEQRVRMKDKFRSGIKERKDILNKLSGELERLRAELASEEVDRETVDILVNKISGLQEDILRRRVDTVYEFRENLTPRQWDRIKERSMRGLIR